MNKPLSREFYARDALTVARALLGKTLLHGETGGVIVETEAYIGPGDRACHAWGGKRTKRTEPLFGESGYAYVYLIYGMYCCLNVVTGGADEPQCVLIRALQPYLGLETMTARRGGRPERELCRGPGKLCQALDITRELNARDMTFGDFLILDGPGVPEDRIAVSKRIGIDYAGEAKDYPWRFFLKGEPWVSR
ncbi:MAG: DNA-3-methyladenine glycosylase [Oscillospiraceae bacterium]|nr:DNA-3-methyladenine glycosylase [Oscillospiraceae bacterium]